MGGGTAHRDFFHIFNTFLWLDWIFYGKMFDKKEWIF